MNYTHTVTVYRDFDPTTQYKICDHQSGLCLAPASTAAGSQMLRVSYNSSAAQKWTITQSAVGKYKVVNFQTGMSLDTSASKTTVGTKIVQAAYTNSATQQWKFASVQDGTGFFQIQPSSVTLDALGAATGTNNIQLESWGWNDDQKWTVSVAQ